MITPYLDRAYRYFIDTSTDGVRWTRVIDRTSNTTTGSLVDAFSTGPIDLRYARLTVTGVYGTTTDWISIQEVSIHDRYDPRVNAAYRGPTLATSSAAGRPPSNATDNGSNTYWASAAKPTAIAPQNLRWICRRRTTSTPSGYPRLPVMVRDRTKSRPRLTATPGSSWPRSPCPTPPART